jgi:probable HAF family extracellular repeat protein
VGANVPTSAVSINDSGQVTGGHLNGTFPPGYDPTGYIYSGGTWTELVDPSADASGSTFPVSINDRGQVIGFFWKGSTEAVTPTEGFLYSNGTWTTLIDPLSSQTQPSSINDAGQFVGVYYNGSPTAVGFIATPTDVDNAREPPKLAITGHSLRVSADGSVALPISVSAKDADDTVSIKISGLPSYDTITAGDGHVVAKKGDSYTFTEADGLSGLTLHSSNAGEDHYHHDQATLTVTAKNTTADEAATSPAQTIKVKEADTGQDHGIHIAALFDQYAAAGFHNEHDSAGQMTSSPDEQGHQENLQFLSKPHH